jgi:hypothetical protein
MKYTGCKTIDETYANKPRNMTLKKQTLMRAETWLIYVWNLDPKTYHPYLAGLALKQKITTQTWTPPKKLGTYTFNRNLFKTLNKEIRYSGMARNKKPKYKTCEKHM